MEIMLERRMLAEQLCKLYQMNFYPKSYFKNILEVNTEFLKNKNIKAILLDIDNTILGSDGKTIEGLENWAENMKKNNIKLCILSNTNKKKKAQRMGQLLDIPYIYFAKKPLKYNFLKAKKILKVEQNEQIAVIRRPSINRCIRCKQM